MNQFLQMCNKIIDQGEWVYNERTGKRCLTLINVDLEYDLSKGCLPILTTKLVNYKGAIAELLGFLRGYTSAAQFRLLGTKTWDANANLNKDWLANPNRKGEDDCGVIYGAVARNFPKHDGTTIDLLRKVYNNLRNGVDDRGEIITFYNPGLFDLGCLRPCMHTHHFSLLGDKLYLTSFQRSLDTALGYGYNSLQASVFLYLMSIIISSPERKIKPAKVFHKIVNAHIYEDQLETLKIQLEREPFEPPMLEINPAIKTLEDIETWVTVDDFNLIDYKHHPALKFPFSV